jgi:predicted DCC family thiol-disulfide oxidoreductase YuxK
VNTEITDKDVNESIGWIFYDAECAFCVRVMNRCNNLFARRGFCWLSIQTPGMSERLGIDELSLGEEMKVLLADERVVGGVDAWALLFRSVWWLWPLGALLSLPGVHWLGVRFYHLIAINRYCIGNACVTQRDLCLRRRNTLRNRHDAFFKFP